MIKCITRMIKQKNCYSSSFINKNSYSGCESSNRYVSVPEFYAGKSVLITGGSGYLGKVLIEKLLYSCPRVENVYVLLREKMELSVEQRMKNIIDTPVFSRLTSERPEFFKKLVLIKGDLSTNELNMSARDLQSVKDNVSIIIHSAATVNFNETMKVALTINYEGTKNVLELCKRLQKCDAFVYISTAYSNCNRSVIEELVYPPPATIDEANRLKEQDSGYKDMTPFLNKLPNAYTFSKALAENILSDTHGDIPTVIVRPSIVTGSNLEPVQGLVDNWFGPARLMTLSALGVGRTMYAEYDNNLDIIPVDYGCNLILVAATRAEKSNKVAVFNSCSGYVNPITIGDAWQLYIDAGLKDKFNMLPFPRLILYSKRKWVIQMANNLIHIIARAADLILQIQGRKPVYEKSLMEYLKIQQSLQFFSSNSWLMKTPNALALAKSLSPEDYQKFPCNPQDIDYKQYIPKYFRGVKKYLIEKAT